MLARLPVRWRYRRDWDCPRDERIEPDARDGRTCVSCLRLSSTLFLTCPRSVNLRGISFA